MSNLSSKYRYVAKNSIALFIGNFASKLLVFFLLPLYTSILTTSEYAVADLINTTIGLLHVVFSLSFSDAILRFAMDERNDKTKILTVGLSVFAVGGIVVGGIGFVVYFIPAFKTYSEYALVAVLLYVSSSLEKLFASFVKGLENIKLISIVGVISTCVVITSNLIMLVLLKWGITGYLLSYVLSHFVACVVYFFAGRVYRYLRFERVERKFFFQMLAYSAPLIFTQICWQLDASAAKYIVNFFSDDATVGMLSAALKIPAVLTLVITLFSQAWNLSAIKEDGTEGSKEFYGNMFDVYWSLIVLVSSGMIIGVELLAHILLKGDFLYAWRYIPFHILAFVCNSISSFLGSFYLAKKQTKALLRAVLLGTGINIALNIVLFPQIGLVGTGVAAIVGYLTIAWLRLNNCMKEKIFFFNKWKVFFSFFIMVLLSVCMTFGSGILMYIISCILFILILIVNLPSVFGLLKKLFVAYFQKN